jgi:PIN domain nuclease of toxin-antitoxin system
MTATDIARSELLLLDTHTLIWSVENDPKLGPAVRQNLNIGARENRNLVSAITPWEIGLLVSKNRLSLGPDVMDWINEALAQPGVKLVGLEPEIAVSSTRFPFEMHPDPADRILVATARRLGATLVTADRLLLGLAEQKCFRAMDATL